MCACAGVAVGGDPGGQMVLVCVCTERLQASRLPSDHDKTCVDTRSYTLWIMYYNFKGGGIFQFLFIINRHVCAGYKSTHGVI